MASVKEALGVILVERLAKAESFAALLGCNWNVVCFSGSVPETVFPGDIPQVEVTAGHRVMLPPDLLAAKLRFKRTTNVYIATDATLMGEVAAVMIARVLDLPRASRIEIQEVSEEGLARAISRARRIDHARVALYESERKRSRRIGAHYRNEIKSVMGREDFFPETFERILLGFIVDRERRLRLENRTPRDSLVLHFDGWSAQLDASETTLVVPMAPHQSVIVTGCTTHAHPDPAPPALMFQDLVHAARTRFGLTALDVHSASYRLYLRGLITWPMTTSARLDSSGLRAAWSYARAAHYPVQDERLAIKNRPVRVTAGNAIRPTDMQQTSIDGAQELQDLYALIHERTVLSVLEPSVAKERRVALELKVGASRYRFSAGGVSPVLRGWRLAATSGSVPGPGDDEVELPLLNLGDRLDAEVRRERIRSSSTLTRYQEHEIGAAFDDVPIVDCSDWYRALRNLQDQSFVRIRAGVIAPTPFGVSVMHAIRSLHAAITSSTQEPSTSGAQASYRTV